MRHTGLVICFIFGTETDEVWNRKAIHHRRRRGTRCPLKSFWHAFLVAMLATTPDNSMAGAISPLGSFFHYDFPSQLFTPRLGLLVTLVIILVAQYIKSPWRKVPPGPKGFPILGNALQLKNKGWMYSAECKRKFGSSSSFFFF